MSANGCNCRLCAYDDEFAAVLAHVPAEHRAFFEELKERWEAADFDACWYRGCVGGEDYTVEFCARYDAERAKVTRRLRDRDRDPEGDETRSGSVERSEIEPGPSGIAQNPSGDIE